MTKTQFRSALEQLDLNQGQAAEALHKSLRSVCGWANGEEPVPYLVAEVLRLWIKHGRD